MGIRFKYIYNKRISMQIECKSLGKEFPGVQALTDINLHLKEKIVYGLIGHNGAGKSTLVNILTGLYPPTNGQIFINGKGREVKNPYFAQEMGITITHQEIDTFPNLTVKENISYGDRKLQKGIIKNKREAENRVKKMLEDIGVEIDLDEKIENCSASERKWISLARALITKPDTIILDELTAYFDKREVDSLFRMVKELKNQGKTIIFISHRLDEVFKISDKILVLRDGLLRGIFEKKNKSFPKSAIIEAMMGKGKERMTFPERRGEGEKKRKKIFSVRGLNAEKIKNIDLDLYSNEIVAVTGLRGHGQSEVLRVIAGIEKRTRGEFYLNGKKIKILSPIDARKYGIRFISDNLDTEGLFSSQNISFNITLSNLDEVLRYKFLSKAYEWRKTGEIISDLNIEPSSPSKIVRNLSGGNKQKVQLGRAIFAQPKIFLADQPTSGLDIGAKREIYRILRDVSEKGASVLVNLREIPELLNLPDRILVMRGGRIVKRFTGKINRKELMDALT